MPTRKRQLTAAAAARPQRRPSRRNIDSILTRRQALVEEVARLRERDGTSKLTDNALQLLTRWWASAGWTAREDLLSTVDWLLQLERQRDRNVVSA